MLTDVLLSTIFFLLPFFLGNIFTKKIFLSWCLGAFFFYAFFLGSFFILKFLKIPYIFSSLISGISFTLTIIYLIVLINRILKNNSLNFTNFISKFKNIRAELACIFVLIFLLTFNYFYIWRNQTPFPLNLNWDIYEHIILANNIAKGNLNFFPSSVSDTFTFNGYSTIFHSLLVLPKLLSNTNLLWIYWWMEYWYFLIVILTSFFILRLVTKDLGISLFGSFLSSLIFQSSIVYNPFFLLPQTWAGLLAYVCIFSLIYQEDNLLGKKKLIYSGIPLVVIFLFHFVIGSLALAAFVIIFFLKKYQYKYINLVSFLSLLALILSISSHGLGKFIITNREEANYFSLSLTQIFTIFFQWYNLTLLLFPLGLYYIWKKKTDFKLKSLLICSLLTLAVSLTPLSYFLKFFVLAGFFFNITIILGFSFISNFLSSFVRFLVMACVILVMYFVFIVNQNKYKEPLYFEGNYSHISNKEVDAAIWLSSAYSPNTLIISDPSTQNILSAISGLNSQGGAYMNIDTREKLISVNLNQDPAFIKQTLAKINDFNKKAQPPKRLFIVGGRYFDWQKLPLEQKRSFYFNIWRPHEISYIDVNYLNFLTANFRVVYQNNELVILEI